MKKKKPNYQNKTKSQLTQKKKVFLQTLFVFLLCVLVIILNVKPIYEKMLRLLDSSKSLHSYSDYYESFIRTHSVKKDKRAQNNIAIKRAVNGVDFMIVDGISLITTTCTDILPFVPDENNVIKKTMFINPRNRRERLQIIGKSLGEWIISVTKNLPSLRMIVINFPCKPKPSISTSSHSTLLFSKSDILEAPASVFVKIFNWAIEYIASTNLTQLIPDTLKLIGQFNGTEAVPLIASFVSDPTNNNSVSQSIGSAYNPPVIEISSNEWLSRYMDTTDTLRFFLDLIATPGTDYFKQPMIYTTDEHCFSPLLRLLLEKKELSSVHVLLYGDDNDSIYCNIKSASNIVFNIMIESQINGTTSQLVSDIFMLDIISEFYTDVQDMLDEYKEVRKNIPVVELKLTGKVEMKPNQEKLGAIKKLIEDKTQGWEMFKNKMAFTMFMADIDTILETPTTPRNHIHGVDFREKLKDSIKIWLIINKIFIDVQMQMKFDSRAYETEIFFAVPEGLLDIIPYVKSEWGGNILQMSDLIDFIKSSQHPDAVHVRSTLSGNRYDTLIGLEFDQPEDPSLPEPQNPTSSINILTQFLQSFEIAWKNEIWSHRDKLSRFTLLKYTEDIPDPMRPMFTRMGQRRLEYLISSKLLEKDTLEFASKRQWDTENIHSTLLDRMNFQMMRKYPKMTFGMNLSVVDPASKTEFSILKTEELTRVIYPSPIHSAPNYPADLHDDLKKYIDYDTELNYLSTLIKYLVPKYNSYIDVTNPAATFKEIKLIPEKQNVPKSNWTIMDITTTYASASESKWPHVQGDIVALALIGIFCCKIPPSIFQPSPKSPRWNSVHMCKSHLTFIIKSLNGIDSVSIYTLSRLIKTLTLASVTWKLRNKHAMIILYRFCKICYTTDTFKSSELPTISKKLSNPSESEGIYSTIMTMIANDMNATDSLYIPKAKYIKIFNSTEAIIAEISGMAGYNRVHDMIAVIFNLRFTCSTELKSAQEVLDFLIRVIEYIDCRVSNTQFRSKELIYLASEFSFDPYQLNPNSFRKRLYKIDKVYLKSMNDDFKKDHYSDYDSEQLNILNNIPDDRDVIAPTGVAIMEDPIDKNHYFCLRWDLEDLSEENKDLIKMTLNKLGTPESYTGQVLEVYAAAWWISVPHIRAKVYARSPNETWDTTRWTMWLIERHSKEPWTDLEVRVNPLSYLINRFKLFSTELVEYVSQNRLIIEEYGLENAESSALWPSIFKRIALRYTDFKFRTGVPERRLLGQNVKQLAGGSSPGNAKFIRENEAETEIELERQQWIIVPCYTDKFKIQSGDVVDICNEYKSITQCMITIPRLKEFVVDQLQSDSFVVGEDIKNFKNHRVTIDDLQHKHLGVQEYITFIQEYTFSLKLVDDPDSDRFKEVTKRLLSKLPLYYGISYKFYLYIYSKRDYYLVDGKNLVPTTYKIFMDDKTMNKKYVVFTKMGSDIKHIVFQGVVGNVNRIDEMVGLFKYAYYFKSFYNDNTDNVSTLKNLTQMSMINSKLSRQRIIPLYEALENAKNTEDYEFVFMRITSDETRQQYEEIFRDRYEDLKYTKMANMVYGYRDDTEKFLIAMFHVMLAWYEAQNTPDSAILDSLENPMSVQNQISVNVHTYKPNESGLTLYSGPKSPFALYTTTRHIFKTDTEEYINSIGLVDTVDALESLSEAVNRYKRYRLVYIKDLMYIAECMGGYSLLEYIIAIKSLPMFYIKSHRIAVYIFDHITRYSDKINSNFTITPEQLEDLYYREVTKINDMLFVIDAESAQNLLDCLTDEKIKQKTILLPNKSIDTQDLNSQTELIEPMIEYIHSKIASDIAYMFQDAQNSAKSAIQRELIDRAEHKTIMKNVIKRLNEGEYEYRVTEKEYSQLGISVPTSAIDSDILWEQVSQLLSHGCVDLFENGGETDTELSRLDTEIAKSSGLDKYRREQRKKKIIRELTEGRVVMLYMLENDVQDPESDGSFILLLYKTEVENRPIPKIRQPTNMSKIEIEKLYRDSVTRILARDGARLVYTGVYTEKNEKETSKKFDTCPTLYIPANNKSKQKFKSLHTLLEAIYINVRSDNTNEPYMQYLTMDDIRNLYTVTNVNTRTGPVPLIQIIDLEDTEKIFGDKYKSAKDKAVEILKKYVIKNFDVFVVIYTFRVAQSGMKQIETTEIPGDPTKKNLLPFYLMFVDRGKQSKAVKYFEPLFQIQ